MKEINETHVKNVIDTINTFRKNNGLKELTEKQLSRVIGNNGMNVGDSFRFTGEIDLNVPIKDNSGKMTGTYIGLKTDKGTYVSIKTIMNVTSLRGYVTKGEVIEEYEENKKTQSRTYKAELVEDFDFSEVYQPLKRNEMELAALLIENPEIIKDMECTLLGIVYKPYKAAENGKHFNGDIIKVGMQRVIPQKLFALAA